MTSQSLTTACATRERCGVCNRINAVGFSVPDDVWAAVVHPSRLNDIHCLACFTDRADARMVDWAANIKFWPVSLVSLLTYMGWQPPGDNESRGDV